MEGSLQAGRVDVIRWGGLGSRGQPPDGAAVPVTAPLHCTRLFAHLSAEPLPGHLLGRDLRLPTRLPRRGSPGQHSWERTSTATAAVDFLHDLTEQTWRPDRKHCTSTITIGEIWQWERAWMLA